jgi:hypothetical protein
MLITSMIRTLFASLLLCGALTAGPSWRLLDEFISPASEGYDCHSSSLIETEAGKLCAAWKAKKGQSYGAWVSLFDGLVHMIYAHAPIPHKEMRIKHIVIDTTTITTTGGSR